jgi:hypothetical protein
LSTSRISRLRPVGPTSRKRWNAASASAIYKNL